MHNQDVGSLVQKAGEKGQSSPERENVFLFFCLSFLEFSWDFLLFNVVRNKEKLPFFYLQLSDEHRRTEKKRNYGQLSAPLPSVSSLLAEVVGSVRK